MKRFGYALGLLALACAAAACNSGNSSNTPAPACTVPVAQYALVYPAPNATAVPDQIQQIIIGSTSALPNSWDAVLTYPGALPNYGSAVATVQPPFPSPTATPSFANPVYQSSAFTNLVIPSGATVSVFLNDLNSGCAPTGPIATFKTL